jgi:lysylphosphatidylglycerol synthetase-like protein (DUF2156 family)
MEDVAPLETKVCANIGPKERALRVRIGFIGAGLTLLAVGGLLETHSPWWARVLVALPAFVGAMGFFQATAQTCVAFARRGIIVLGDRKDAKRVDSDELKARIASQVRRVYINAAITTAAVVALVLVIP